MRGESEEPGGEAARWQIWADQAGGAVQVAEDSLGGEITAAVRELQATGIPVITLNMVGSVTSVADLVVSDPVQSGTMAVMAIADTARFSLERARGRRL